MSAAAPILVWTMRDTVWLLIALVAAGLGGYAAWREPWRRHRRSRTPDDDAEQLDRAFDGTVFGDPPAAGPSESPWAGHEQRMANRVRLASDAETDNVLRRYGVVPADPSDVERTSEIVALGTDDPSGFYTAVRARAAEARRQAGGSGRHAADMPPQ